MDGGLGERVAAKRAERGWSQNQLAKRIGSTQQAVQKIEGGSTRNPRFIVELAQELGVSIEWLRTGKEPEPGPDVNLAEARPLADGPRDLPVYSAAEGGDDGAWALSGEPIEYARRPEPLATVRDAFAVYVTGDSMIPAFRPGDQVFVHPHRPPGRGVDAVFEAEVDGMRLALLKHLIRWSGTHWDVEQFNPPKRIKLLRSKWLTCHVVVGKYSAR